MRFWRKLESNLERHIEGFFQNRSEGDLQPVKVARKLAREMSDRSRPGLREVYAPNRYVVYLDAGNYARAKAFVEQLSSEFSTYLAGKAVEKNYTLPGPVTVHIEEDKNLAPGKFRVESFFTRAEDLSPLTEDTLCYTPVCSGGSLREQPVNGERPARLEVTEGVLRGRQFTLDDNLVVLGRRETCDVYLPDASVSRRHAVVMRQGRRYVIRDQGSTNGTYVNGEKVENKVLGHGDIIKLGKTVLVFKVE